MRSICIILYILLLSPLLSYAQAPKPVFKNDTVYTMGGYPIYAGSALNFNKGSGHKGAFRFVKIKNGIMEYALKGSTVIVTRLYNFGLNFYDEGQIDVTGIITFKDGSRTNIELKLYFDKAIEHNGKLPAELTIPAEFVNNDKIIFSRQLRQLLDQYVNGTLSKSQYEEQKRKLVNGYTSRL